MITIICLIIWRKLPHEVLGLGRFMGLLLLEGIILLVVLR
jgi:hypothetical protein